MANTPSATAACEAYFNYILYYIRFLYHGKNNKYPLRRATNRTVPN